jgi:hypothetical protein
VPQVEEPKPGLTMLDGIPIRVSLPLSTIESALAIPEPRARTIPKLRSLIIINPSEFPRGFNGESIFGN